MIGRRSVEPAQVILDSLAVCERVAPKEGLAAVDLHVGHDLKPSANVTDLDNIPERSSFQRATSDDHVVVMKHNGLLFEELGPVGRHHCAANAPQDQRENECDHHNVRSTGNTVVVPDPQNERTNYGEAGEVRRASESAGASQGQLR
jgi:hypothetical protein